MDTMLRVLEGTTMRRLAPLLLLIGALVWPQSLAAQSWVAPITWSTSQLVSAANLNEQIRDNMTVLRTGELTGLDISGAAIFNEAGADIDFRMEGDTDVNLFFLDASTDTVGIGTATPGSQFEVAGDDSGQAENAAQIQIVGATDANKQLRIGYDTTSNFGWIQPVRVGTGQDALALNPDGAFVGIGLTGPATILEVENSLATTGIQISNTATDGDPFLSFALSGTSLITMGVDDGDSDAFKIGTTAIGTSTRLSISTAGVITFNGAYAFPTSDGTADYVLGTDGAGTVTFRDSGVPSGLIAIFDAACSTGWTRVTAFDNKFLRGGATYVASGGGADTHDHGVDPPDTGSGQPSGTGSVQSGAGSTVALSTHNHQVDIGSFTSGNGSNVPVYSQVVFCKKD